jgi:hypothetical protein
MSATVRMRRTELAVISNCLVKCDFLPRSLYIVCVNNRLSLPSSFVVVRTWPPRFPDLNSSDLYLWGHIYEAAKHCAV